MSGKPEERVLELERGLEKLLENERALSAAPSAAGLADEILRQAMAATHADAGSIFLKDPKSGNFTCAAALGEKAAAVRVYSIPPGRGIVGAVAESGKPLVTEAAEDPRHDKSLAQRLEYPVQKILAVPISAEGVVTGVLELLTRAGSPVKFDQDDIRVVSIMAGQAGRAIEAARNLEQRMQAQRLETLSLVIRGVVHDVRNPLTFINGYAEILGDTHEGGDTPQRNSARDAIYRNVQDIDDMLRELADFTAGSDTTHKQPTDVVELVNEVVKQFRPRAESARIKVSVRIRLKDAKIAPLDGPKIRRVVANLVKNAIEATPSSGRITVVAARYKSDIYLWVRDSGRGVPPEVMTRLFEPFVTHGKKGGTGLGLSICRRFAEQHGGEVGCRTRMGKGTRFIVRLPL